MKISASRNFRISAVATGALVRGNVGSTLRGGVVA